VNIVPTSVYVTTTTSTVCDTTKLKGLIGKPGLLKVTTLTRPNRDKKEGKTLKRISGSTYTGPKPEEKKVMQPTLQETPHSEEKIISPSKKGGTQPNSEANSEIATSWNSMRLEIKNTLWDNHSRAKAVE